MVRFKEWVERNLRDIKKGVKDNNNILLLITQKLEKMGKVNDELLSLLKDMDTETNEISEKLDEYASKVEGTVAPETVAGFRSLSARLKSLGKDPENPIPVPPVEPAPTDPTIPAPEEPDPTDPTIPAPTDPGIPEGPTTGEPA